MKRNNIWLESFRLYIEQEPPNVYGVQKEAHRKMMSDLRSGKDMPCGLGDWRKIWPICYPDEQVPAKCPSCWMPPGSSYNHLQRLLGGTKFLVEHGKAVLDLATEPIILKYLQGNPTIMAAIRAFQYDFFTGVDLGLQVTWRTIYSSGIGELWKEDFPVGWYPKSFDLEAFKAVAASSGLQIPLGEDH
jgi:hypothetical protein